MYTMRDTDDEKLFARVGRIMPKIEAKLEAAKQARIAEKQAASTPTASTNGTAPTPTPAAEADDHYCDLHDAPLKQFSKDGRTWYSHKADDGQWCRGR